LRPEVSALSMALRARHARGQTLTCLPQAATITHSVTIPRQLCAPDDRGGP
jgi:hypothetical protein